MPENSFNAHEGMGLSEDLLRNENARMPVAGDEARQAVASLGGYSYQVYVSALAWLDLTLNTELYLEVAEDFATAASGALRAVQVKATQGTVSLASEPVRAAIASFVDLVSLNAGRTVRFTYLTTARITMEHALAHRPGENPGIEEWRSAAEGGEVGHLRRVLLALNLGEKVHAYVREREDGRLRMELLKRIEWRCGEGDLNSVAARLVERVVRLCFEDYGVPLAEGEKFTANVFLKVLETCSQAGLRVLTQRDLQALLSGLTRVTVARDVWESMLDRASASTDSWRRARPWFAEAELPLPTFIVSRPLILDKIQAVANETPVIVLHGGTGMGKTLVARLAARRLEGLWNILELRNRGIDQSGDHLLAYSRRKPDGSRGLIMDDVPDLQIVEGTSDFVRAFRTLADRGELVVITTARAPSARLLGLLGMAHTASLPVPCLSTSEMLELVKKAGGDENWVLPILAGARGHPQLASALVIGLKARGWPQTERDALSLANAAELQEEAASARKRLIQAVPDSMARNMLHRVSVVSGRFPRALALALGKVPPPATLPGELFDGLVGPWVDQVSASRFSISPLLVTAGHEVLDPEELLSVQTTIAECLTAGKDFEVDQIDNVVFHAIESKADRALFKLSAAIVTSSDSDIAMLSRHAPYFRSLSIVRPIFLARPNVSVMLRIAQFLLVSAKGFGDSAASCARTLIEELANIETEARTALEVTALTKILFRPGMSAMLPEWPELVARFVQVAAHLPELPSLPEDPIGSAGPGPVMFGSGLNELTSVAQLADCFKRLTAIEASVRNKMLMLLPGLPGRAVQVLSPWLKQRDGGDIDAPAAIGLYRDTSELAASWGQFQWAIALRVAAAELLNEELDDLAAAMLEIQSARVTFGGAPWLDRAEQKLQFQLKDDAVVVELVAKLVDSFAKEPIELAHMLREGAISASRLGDHHTALTWFKRADGVAIGVDNLAAMALGFAADCAAEIWRAGDRPAALGAMAHVLDRLAVLDPKASFQNAYVHRIVRHSLLWFAHSAGMAEVEVDGRPPVLPPGVCSNPHPMRDIVGLPLLDIAIAWYLLAETSLFAGFPGAVPDVVIKVQGAPFTGLEVGLRRHRLDRAIFQSDAVAFIGCLPDVIDAVAVVPVLIEWAKTHTMGEWQRGTIAKVDHSDLRFSKLVRNAALAFRIVASVAGRSEISAQLRQLLAESTPLGRYAADRQIFALGELEPLGKRPISACVDLIDRTDLTPVELLESCLRIAMWLEGSDHRKSVERVFVGWAKAAWLRVAVNQAYLLTMPRLSARRRYTWWRKPKAKISVIWPAFSKKPCLESAYHCRKSGWNGCAREVARINFH